MKYAIFYRDREYARSQGDPCLGTVEADSKEEAEQKAVDRGLLIPGAGVWAVKINREIADENLPSGAVISPSNHRKEKM